MEGVTPEHILKAFSKWTGKVSLQVESDGVFRIESQEADPQMRMWVQEFF